MYIGQFATESALRHRPLAEAFGGLDQLVVYIQIADGGPQQQDGWCILEFGFVKVRNSDWNCMSFYIFNDRIDVYLCDCLPYFVCCEG